MTCAARTSHAEGVANGNRTAIDVEQLVRNAQLVTAIKNLNSERLVQFPQSDVIHLQAIALKQLGNGIDRADAHFVRLGTCNSHADISAKRCKTALFGNLGFHHDTGRRTIAQLAGVASRNAMPLAHYRLEACKPFKRRIGAVTIVAICGDFLIGNFLGFLVHHRHCRCAGNDLVIKLAGFLCCGGALLRLERILILILAANVITLGDHFCSTDHRHVDMGMHFQQFAVGFDKQLAASADLGNTFHAASNANVHIINQNLLRCRRDCHQA